MATEESVLRSSPALEASTNCVPFLDNLLHLQQNFDRFSENLLCTETTVIVLQAACGIGDGRETVLRNENFVPAIDILATATSSQNFLFINNFLVLNKHEQVPEDTNKLQLQPAALTHMINRLRLPVSFVSSLIQLHLPVASGTRSHLTQATNAKQHREFWYNIPVRVQYRCRDKEQKHTASSASSNQMDPRHFLHLPDLGVDVRGSQIAVFTRMYDEGGHLTIVFNFMDGRWSQTVQEPKQRIVATCQSTASDAFQAHLIYHSSAVRWWTNTLSSVNDQLIAYEKILQDEINIETNPSDTYNLVNRALHAVAAHLQRYSTELSTIQRNLTFLQKCHDHHITVSIKQDKKAHFDHSCMFQQLDCHFSEVQNLEKELSVKLQNILDLLFNRIQITNDQMMVANGEKMHAILMATQEDAKISREIAIQSRELSKDMKKDSVAMKTIAVTTMFFLPGTSFAALLAMPFFDHHPYITKASQAWIWVICTIPSTLIAFTFYWLWRKREEKKVFPILVN